MKKKKKIIVIAAILAVILAVGVSVSIYLYINRFDAGEYVQAVLDTSYKNETDQYVEITGISQEEAEKIFDDNLDATMAGFENSEMPENMQPKYRELFGEIARKVSYTIGKPEKQEDGTYIVPVIVKPVVMNGAEMPTDEEMQNQIYQIYYDVLRKRVDSGMLYGGARNVQLHVTKTSSREFTIDQEDMDRLDSMLIESVDVGE